MKLGIRPGLAESWIQPDPKTLVFKLRRGVKFHDGTDFNAEAAKFNFNRMKTEPKSVRKGETASIDTIDVVDSHTIKLNLRRPDAALLAHAHDILNDLDSFRKAVRDCIESESRDYPEDVKTELARIEIDNVSLCWPDRPADGMIFFRGPSDSERLWRCDYIARKPTGLGCDT